MLCARGHPLSFTYCCAHGPGFPQLKRDPLGGWRTSETSVLLRVRNTGARSRVPTRLLEHTLLHNSSQRSAPLIRHPLSFCPAAVMALAVAACGAELTEPTHGVFLLTDAREYQLPPPSQPPMSMFATISNQTFAGVPVRRCFIRGSAVDPVGADLVFEEAQSNGTWEAVDLGFNCLGSAAPRADVVLAPREVALVARIVIRTPGRFRIRVGYGAVGDTAPADTATSAAFTVR